LDNTIDDIDDLGLESWESHEDFVDDIVSHELKVCIDILDKIQGGFSEFLELRSQ
jgi:hypothetical protein